MFVMTASTKLMVYIIPLPERIGNCLQDPSCHENGASYGSFSKWLGNVDDTLQFFANGNRVLWDIGHGRWRCY
jgi:hypothetical protein